MHSVITIIFCLPAFTVSGQPIPHLRQPSNKLSFAPSAPFASLRRPSRASLSPASAGREPSSWNPLDGLFKGNKDKKKPATPPDVPSNNEEIVTMCKITEDGSECQQALIQWGNENKEFVRQFGQMNGFKTGNCMLKGYPEFYHVQKHNLPVIGEVTMRHFKKSSQLQFQSSTSLNLLTNPDAVSSGTLVLIGLVAWVGTFTVLRFCHHTSVVGKPQLIPGALLHH